MYIQGHVEILHDGIWGTICDDKFNDNAARVICRMAGYSKGKDTFDDNDAREV